MTQPTSQEVKHTPRWELRVMGRKYGLALNGAPCIVSGDDFQRKTIAIILDEQFSSLLAAAPEMLSALKAISEQLECPARNTHLGRHYGSAVTISSDVKAQIQAAILKAGGQ